MSEATTTPAISIRYAGFWRRFCAFVIDYLLISVVVFPLVAMIGMTTPDNVVVSVPFGLFTTEKVLESASAEQKNADGSTSLVETQLIEVLVLGHWRYLYHQKIERSGGETTTTRQLLDPGTHLAARRSTSDDFIHLLLMIYWILMESSRWQASVGKLALGMKVTDEQGLRLSFVRALGRNLLKILSCATLMIGFMMAGWTQKKQALHDKIADCLVTVRR